MAREIWCNLGFMQGRLSPLSSKGLQVFPQEGWADELPLGRQIGFASVEWLIDRFAMLDNPLVTNPERVRYALRQSGVSMRSVCLDAVLAYDWKTVDESHLVGLVAEVLKRAEALECEVVCVPFLESMSAAAIGDPSIVVGLLTAAYQMSGVSGIRVALETDLGTDELVELFSKLSWDFLGVTLDIGNLTGLKEDPIQQFDLLIDRVELVHLKDRDAQNHPVLIGEGLAPLSDLVGRLARHAFLKPITLECFRAMDYEKEVSDQFDAVQDLFDQVGRARFSQ